jgi:hypothetical protein
MRRRRGRSFQVHRGQAECGSGRTMTEDGRRADACGIRRGATLPMGGRFGLSPGAVDVVAPAASDVSLTCLSRLRRGSGLADTGDGDEARHNRRFR